MTNLLHIAAVKGFAKEAQTYSRGRPDYPAELDLWLSREVRIGRDTSCVDVGAGTGKFTRQLVASGARTFAVEPVGAMREQLTASLPSVIALNGTAQCIPLKDASVDAVVCAQAFHWFATNTALAEFHRVLKPGGRLALIWNVRDESVDWVTALTEIITPYEGDAPRFYKGDWRRPFQQNPPIGFTALQESRFDYVHEGSPEQVIVDRFMSVSFIAALPASTITLVRLKIQELIATHPALREQPTVRFPYTTRAFMCMRVDR